MEGCPSRLALHDPRLPRAQLIREHAADVQRQKMQERMDYEEALQQEMEEKMLRKIECEAFSAKNNE